MVDLDVAGVVELELAGEELAAGVVTDRHEHAGHRQGLGHAGREGGQLHAVDGGLADGDALNFAGNLLTVIVPADNPGGLASPADLAKPGLKVIAAGDDVPITTYATQVVGLLAKTEGYPAGFAAGYAANVVSKEDDVQAVVAKTELGEGDAAIVYLTDARASSKVASIAIPPRANIPAVYGGVVVKSSPNVAAAHAFVDWLTGAEAQLILAQLGFTEPAS